MKATPKHRHDVDLLLTSAVAFLLIDKDLPTGNRDHALVGNWAGYRECHIKPDLLLIYRKPDMETLHLVRLGSHSELFG